MRETLSREFNCTMPEFWACRNCEILNGCCVKSLVCHNLSWNNKRWTQHYISSYQICFPQWQAINPSNLLTYFTKSHLVQGSGILLSREKVEKSEQSEAHMRFSFYNGTRKHLADRMLVLHWCLVLFLLDKPWGTSSWGLGCSMNSWNTIKPDRHLLLIEEGVSWLPLSQSFLVESGLWPFMTAHYHRMRAGQQKMNILLGLIQWAWPEVKMNILWYSSL